MSNLAESLIVYTYEDYKSWPGDFRCELIDGLVYMMASPNVWHQEMVGYLYRKLGEYLDGKKCKVYLAPLYVRLFPRDDEKDDTYPSI